MSEARILARLWPLGLTYGLVVGAAIAFTRFDHGVAWIWPGTALVIVALLKSARRQWWAVLGLTGAINFLLTGLIGLGWWAALPFALLNASEAAIAAHIFKRRRGWSDLLANLSWLGRFLIAVVAAPLLAAPVAGLIIWLGGGDGLAAVWRFASGHALGNLTITPIAYLLSGRAERSEAWRLLKRRRTDAAVVFPLLVIVTAYVFHQSSLPLLFLPMMFVILATFRLGKIGAALSILLLAAIGGTLTVVGLGPIRLAPLAIGERLQFLQFYLATTVMTVLPIAADLNHRRKLSRKLKRSEAEFRMLAERCTDAILRISPSGHIRYASPSIMTLSGHHPPDLVGTPSARLIDPLDREMVTAAHQDTLRARGEARSYDYRGVTAEGERRWYSTHARALLDDGGRAVELLAFVRDITEAKRKELLLVDAALTDRLTGLPNRRALEVLVARRRAAGLVDRDCIAMLDLDRFKAINDSYGHDVGDAVLRGFADVAQQVIRDGDMVARLGGEEFVMLFEQSDIERAYRICERLRQQLSTTPLQTSAGPLRVTVSVGLAPLGRDGLAASLKRADTALYRAKHEGRDRLVVADQPSTASAQAA